MNFTTILTQINPWVKLGIGALIVGALAAKYGVPLPFPTLSIEQTAYLAIAWYAVIKT